MAYCTVTDVQKRALLLQQVDSSKIVAGIAWADSLLEARLGGRYAVPFTPVPTIIRELSADLAAYYIIFEEHTAGGEGVPVEAALELKNRAYDLVKELQSGNSILPGVVGSGGAAPSPSILTSNPEPNILREFDLVNVPLTNRVPFSPYMGGGL